MRYHHRFAGIGIAPDFRVHIRPLPQGRRERMIRDATRPGFG